MPSGRLYTIYTVMQITKVMRRASHAGPGPYKLRMLNSDAVRRMEGR
jgi:hypothetical protein